MAYDHWQSPEDFCLEDTRVAPSMCHSLVEANRRAVCVVRKEGGVTLSGREQGTGDAGQKQRCLPPTSARSSLVVSKRAVRSSAIGETERGLWGFPGFKDRNSTGLNGNPATLTSMGLS